MRVELTSVSAQRGGRLPREAASEPGPALFGVTSFCGRGERRPDPWLAGVEISAQGERQGSVPGEEAGAGSRPALGQPEPLACWQRVREPECVGEEAPPVPACG